MRSTEAGPLTVGQIRDILDENKHLRAVNDALTRRNQILADKQKASPWVYLPWKGYVS